MHLEFSLVSGTALHLASHFLLFYTDINLYMPQRAERFLLCSVGGTNCSFFFLVALCQFPPMHFLL